EIGERTRAAPERWRPLYPAPARASWRAPAGPARSNPADPSGFTLAPDGAGERWLALGKGASAERLLRLRGRSFRAPDPELARGLALVVELLREFLERAASAAGPREPSTPLGPPSEL